MKKTIKNIVIASALVISTFGLSGCAALESVAKDFESDTAKLNRVVMLYDYNGELVDTWEGMMRIESESTQNCSFIIDGKRTQINGGIIVVQEK